MIEYCEECRLRQKRIKELEDANSDKSQLLASFRKDIKELQAKVEDADRQRSILQTNLDAETTGGNVLDRENERLTAKNKRLEARLKAMSVDRDTNEHQIGELHAKVKELEQERNLAWDKGYSLGRDDAHQTIVALQAEIEELEDDALGQTAIWMQQNGLIEELNSIISKASVSSMEKVQKLQAKVERLKGLLNEAKCPCCDGGGAYYDNMGEVCQCQWCYEAKAALKKEGE